tara:strand:- start:488 stop:607 length:120 start_codon:yes stop_codon:yes gene_type:complete
VFQVHQDGVAIVQERQRLKILVGVAKTKFKGEDGDVRKN